jgi:cbb3-type cytochrome oxidase maturation protein
VVYSATWLVLALVAIILVLFGIGYYWARREGQFDDIEAAKFRMLEDDPGEEKEDKDEF